jgi:Na+-driven multidrug efflux pump
MQSSGWIERLRTRWKLDSAWQVIIVLLVFACTGFTVMLLKRPILQLFNSENTTTVTVAYYLLILPVYNVILLAYGFIFGQFDFFWEFEKRFVKRIVSIFKSNKPE